MADYSCQALISLLLSKAYPNDPIVGEEDAKDLRQPTLESKQLKERVCELVNSELSKPLVKGESQILELGQTRDEDELLDAIDRGTFEGGAKDSEW